MKNKWLLLIVVGLIALSGCNNAEKPQKQPGSGADSEKSSPQVKIDEDKGSVEYKDEDSEGRAEVGEDVELPDNYPNDVPVYKNAKILSSITSKTDQVDTMTVTLQSDDSLNDVAQFYKDQLPKNGFSITNQREDKSIAVLSANKDDRTVSIVASRNNDKTSIGINISTRLE